MIPTFPRFSDFYVVDSQEYLRRIRQYEPYSDFNYVSVYSWNEPGCCAVSLLNDNLVLSLKDYIDNEQILTFIGNKRIVDTAKELLSYAADQPNHKKHLQLVPHTVAEQLRETQGLEVHEDHDNHDYMISGEEYALLQGKKFENKRKSLNRYIRQYGDRTEIKVTPLDDPALRQQILMLSRKWLNGGTEGSAMATNEYKAITKLLSSQAFLSNHVPLYCFQLYVGGVLEGFCIFEIHDKYAVTHFGKANTSILNAYEYMMAQLYKYIYQTHGITLINNEQDLGITGLRHSKLSQHPIDFLRKYTVTTQS